VEILANQLDGATQANRSTLVLAPREFGYPLFKSPMCSLGIRLKSEWSGRFG